MTERGLSRRDFLRAGGGALVGAYALGLAGCGGFGVGQSTGGSGGGVTVWEISTGLEKASLLEELARFNEGHPGITAEMQFFENDPYKQKLRVAMGAGNPPDVFYGWGGGILESYVDAGKVFDLTAALEEDPDWGEEFLPNVMEGVTFGGKVYGVPVTDVQPNCVFYNKAIFEEHGLSPPETFDGLKDTVRALKEEGVIPIVLGGQSKWTYMIWMQQLVLRLGGAEPFDKVVRGEAGAWSDPAFVEAGAMFQDLVRMGAFEEGFAGVSFDTGQASALLNTGVAAMHHIGVYDYENHLTADPDFVKENLGWFRFPAVGGGSPVDASGNLANFYSVSQASGDKEKAITFLKEGTLSVETRIKNGAVPPVKGIEARLEEADNSEWVTFVYDLVKGAPSYQLSWDQALSPVLAERLLVNLEQMVLLASAPKDFSAAMNEAMREA